MSDSRSFTLLFQLPKEIRLMIWAHTLQPRVLTLRVDMSSFDAHDPPDFLYFLGGGLGYPLRHFTMDEPIRPSSPYYTAHLYPVRVQSPPALSLCRESRTVALESGYRSWMIENPIRGFRDMVWDPSRDSVLVESHSHFTDLTLQLFTEQFPLQAQQVQRLAIPSSSIPFATSLSIGEPMSELLNLAVQEVVVVLDIPFEKEVVEIVESRYAPEYGYVGPIPDPWKIPESIDASLHGLERDNDGSWTRPKVRVVSSEEKILSSVEEGMVLRCSPCQYLENL